MARKHYARWRAIRAVLALVLLGIGPTAVMAQWLDYKTPGIPRKADGTPNLKAAVPRTKEGKPDFSGMWFANVPSKDGCRTGDCIQEERMSRAQVNIGTTLKDGLPYTEWSKQQMVPRGANGGREDPHTYCMPPNFPRAWTLPQYIKIVQTPQLMVVLHEFNGSYRQIFMDGRKLEKDPNPTWNGHSIAHWDGDVLVIETNGIRDDMWLDIRGSPVTESAKVTERLKRVSFGLMQIEISVDDPKAYTKPWSVTVDMAYQADTAMLEEYCMDDEQDVEMYR